MNIQAFFILETLTLYRKYFHFHAGNPLIFFNFAIIMQICNYSSFILQFI